MLQQHHPIHHAFFFFFFIILLFSFPNYSQSLTTHEDDESGILLSLKRHWGNPSSLEQWNSTSSPCEDWPGISCNFNGSVTGISLYDRGLEGSFPSTIICQLNNLSSIDLNMNYLSGIIPVGLSSCSNLEELDLSLNLLTGKIPGELFSMKTLRILNLQQNKLSGEIPTSMVAYSLESLDLSYNQLNGSIPKDIGNLNNLGCLYLSRNSLSGPIPARLLQLQQLSYLSLSFNKLSGEIPTQLFLYNLSYLYLSKNSLNGSIPGELFSLKNLRGLSLRQNMLSGEIPTPMVSHNLEDLDLSSNHLNGSIPGELFSLKNLRGLSLRQNMLSGEIPTPMVSHNLEDLDLSSNHLNGSIPDDISHLYNLRYLNLSMNSLSGPIPATLLRLNQLAYLSLASNNLTGEIPANLDLFSLIQIDLSHNHLSGSIPRGFGELQQLENIDVSHNKFSGDICEIVSPMSAARRTLRLCKNHFSGRIPYELMEQKYNDRCFDRANLCSYTMDKRLPTCPSQLFSYYSVPQHCASNKPSKSKKIIISVVIAVLLIVGLGILILVFRYAWGRRRENDGEEWSIISFQRLEFNKWDILGGLTDENLIGNGGSGKVYRVITKKGQSVAVKSIWHEQKQGEQGLMEKQFLAEVKILGRIWHNNIVKLLCCIRGKTTKLLVYEYMDKQCLYKWLHGKKRGLTTQVLQWERRLKIAIGASQGLCYMHHSCNPPIIHRDIKSSNILVDSEFNAKIADFGLAKMMASEGDPETASAIVGTFGYIAPEYGSTRKVDAKSDIYSFGVVLLELTTGREAVTGNEDMNLAQWAHKHQREGNSAADALDEEIKDPRYLEAMMAVFKLGLVCTLNSPPSRPSMKDISEILQRCKENDQLSSESQ